jgi:hypothetical protein
MRVMIYGEQPSFKDLMEQISDLEIEINALQTT